MAQLSNLTVNGIEIFEMVYPIGSIYISTAYATPKDLFGFGEWELMKDRFLISAGDAFLAGTTGGSRYHSHTLNNGYAMIETTNNYLQYREKAASFTPTWAIAGTGSAGMAPPHAATAGTQLGGSADTTDVLPPYLVVYIWKRVA